MRASVFSGIDDEIKRIEESVYMVDLTIITSTSDSCEVVPLLAKSVSELNALSTKIMTIANILNIQTNKETVRLINGCKSVLEDIHAMCKVAYLKDEYKGCESIMVSEELRDVIEKYSFMKTSDSKYSMHGSSVKIVLSPDLKGLDVKILDRGGMDGSSKDDCNGI